ncbi:hypothetical protein GCM10027059_32890 [Myceligenerans halotolerans]
MRSRLPLLNQVLLVLVTCLLAIATNYATNVDDAPLVMRLLRDWSVPAVGLLLAALIVAQVAAYRAENPPAPDSEWERGRNPYPGLDAFDDDEAAVYFGRESQVTELVRRLHAASGDRFVVLAGASGSGKSSLLRAGVLPRLRKQRWRVLPVFTPGTNPLASLAAAVAGPETTDKLLVRLQNDPGALRAELDRLRAGARFRQVLLVVDQFEELVTLAGDRERDQFLEALKHTTDNDTRVRVLVAVRMDLLGPLVATQYAELFRSPAVIGALTRTQLVQAVEQPAELAGLSHAPGVVQRIVADTGSEDALPLMAYLLHELFLAADGRTVTLAQYEELGGVEGALARHADETAAALANSADMDSVLQVLLKFVTVRDRDAVRRRVELNSLSADERMVVDAFVAARLLTSNAESGVAFAEVTHEALFRQWAPLRQEVEARSDQLRQRAELERWAEDWESAHRSDDYLLTGKRLAQARQWLDGLTESGQESPIARELVNASLRKDRAYLERVADSLAQRAITSVRELPEQALLLALAALDECAATPLAVRALMTGLAHNHVLLQLSEHTNVVRDVKWSPDGTRLATASRDGTSRIWDAETGRCIHVLPSGGPMMEGVSWSPDSRHVATIGREQSVRIWNAETGEPVRTLRGLTDFGRQVAWSPDGQHIAASCKDTVVRIWDSTHGELVRELSGHRDDVWGLSWAPDGQELATASHDQRVLVWDVSTGAIVSGLTGHTSFVEGVAWEPRGSRIATGSGDHTSFIFRHYFEAHDVVLRHHVNYVWNVAWSPDGGSLATASSDRLVKVVDPDDADELAVLRGHADTVWGVAWAPAGDRLATCSSDATVRTWRLHPRGAESELLLESNGAVAAAAWIPGDSDLANFTATISPDQSYWAVAVASDGRSARASSDGTIALIGSEADVDGLLHGAPAEALAWSADGHFLAAGDHDGHVRIYESESIRSGGADPMQVLTGHQDWISDIAWSASGRFIASGSDDRTARIWDVAGGEQHTVLRSHDNYVDGVAWSPDERHIATASADWTLGIWDVSTGQRIETLKGHEARVECIAWSPDGNWLVTGSDDETVRIWNAVTFEYSHVAGVHRGKVTSVSWSADSNTVMSSSADGTVRAWRREPDVEALTAMARTRVFRTLTPEEREQHLLPAMP